MAEYPDVITNQILSAFSKISNEQLDEDIKSSQADINKLMSSAEMNLASAKKHKSSQREEQEMLYYKNKVQKIKDCKKLIEFLTKIKAARE